MEKRTIRVYKPCEHCKGTGLESDGAGTWDCQTCQGYGETLELEKRGVRIEQLPTGDVRITGR